MGGEQLPILKHDYQSLRQVSHRIVIVLKVLRFKLKILNIMSGLFLYLR